MNSFHEIQFPNDISLEAAGGPQRFTEIVKLASGHEIRNTRRQNSVRKYNAGYGVKSFKDLMRIVDFFEERRGKLFGFRWRDWTDYKSCECESEISALDQILGIGDEKQTSFQVKKKYGKKYNPYFRKISKLVQHTFVCAINNTIIEPSQYNIDHNTGIISFDKPLNLGEKLTAGFEFDVPVRFDTDYLSVHFSSLKSGNIPAIPLVEIII